MTTILAYNVSTFLRHQSTKPRKVQGSPRSMNVRAESVQPLLIRYSCYGHRSGAQSKAGGTELPTIVPSRGTSDESNTDNTMTANKSTKRQLPLYTIHPVDH